MTDAIRDQNHVTVGLGVSSTDSTATLPLKIDPSTGRLLTDGGSGYTNLTQFVDQTPWRLFYSNTNGDVTELAFGANGEVLTSQGASAAPIWSAAAGTGTVTSVAMSVPTGLTITGSPVTTTGTLAVTLTAGYVIPTQAALDAKAPLDSPVFTTLVRGTFLTASEMLITDASKNIVSAAVATYPSLTELTYVKGVTSAIQTQLNAKQSTITFGTGVQTALGVNIGSAGAPVLFNGALGTPTAGTVTNLTGTASININGTVGATTPTTGVFTTLVAGSTTSLLLGTAGSAVGNIGFRNATSGTITLAPVAGALGTVTLTLPAITDTIVVLTATQTLTNKTLTSPTINTATIGGATLLAENASVDLDPTLSADGTYSGIAITGTAGATLAFGDLIYLAVADSRWKLVDADSVTTCGAVLTGMCVLAAAADGNATKILLKGNIRADAAFPALTIGANVYAGLTPGDIVTTAPSATDDVVHVVGKALTADSIYFDPSEDYITIV